MIFAQVAEGSTTSTGGHSFGELTFIYNARTGKKLNVPRLLRRHGNETEDVGLIGPGDICAMFGVAHASGVQERS
ncbi:hypothetical protein FB446DRAFT_654178 [Lentinula raphanica]|nr:hypothetical protein FB446DRAFT_654178 [Lentinula raphanica]